MADSDEPITTPEEDTPVPQVKISESELDEKEPDSDDLEEKNFPFDLGDIENQHFQYASRKSRSGRVLRDSELLQPAKVVPR